MLRWEHESKEGTGVGGASTLMLIGIPAVFGFSLYWV